MNPLADALAAPLAGCRRPVLHLVGGAEMDGPALYALSGRVAGVLAAEGVRPGDRVAMQAGKSPLALAVYLACLRAGAVFVPLNTAYTAAEMAYFLADAAPRLLLVDPAAEPALRPAAASAGARCLTLDADGGGALAARTRVTDAQFATRPRAADDVAIILYTSGTTGRPKGAMLTHQNLLANADALVATWRFTAGDRLLHDLPIYHAHGLFVATNVLLRCGGAMIFLPAFDLDQVFACLPRATAMMGVPTHYTRLLADPRLTRDGVRHLRLFISGSAPLLASTHRAFAARTGHRIIERYGMTETSMNTSNPVDGERRPGSVGPPLPGVEARITDPASGVPLPPGETGMLEIRGPNVFSGYWRMPERTREEFRPDGFFITGDLARADPDGYLVIVGRARDLVISGGVNVYPKEVENEIDALDGILESAVVGAPHADFGEGVVAFAVRMPGSTLTESGVIDGLAERLARFKQPKRVLFVAELPRNAMGKVEKKRLRESCRDVFAGAA